MLRARQNLVLAPAGCGKTQLLADALKYDAGPLPALVLTHTHAGVAALRERLVRHCVPADRYRLATLDGFALRLVRCFPARAQFQVALEADLGPQYQQIRAGCAKVISGRFIDDLLRCSYGRVLIDEYQDCSAHQHAIAAELVRLLPTCVFADDLQAIFGFRGDPLPPWDDVLVAFPVLGELDVPWRWRNAGTEQFGAWLREVRATLLRGEPLDLRTGAPHVRWQQLSGSEGENQRARFTARLCVPQQESLIVIGDQRNPQGQQFYARQCAGMVLVERADLPDLFAHARAFDAATGGQIEAASVDFAKSVMTGVEQGLVHDAEAKRLLDELRATYAADGAALRKVGGLLEALKNSGACRVCRHDLLREMLQTINIAVADGTDLVSAAVRVRESFRHRGRKLPRQAVGSTLLLKGLETDHAIILDADRMDRENLYVALTRATKSVTVFSRDPVLRPQA